MNTPSDSEGIIERLDRPDSPEELASRNLSGPDANLVHGPPTGSGIPGDASGPDIWSNDSGPLQAPRETSYATASQVAPGTLGQPGIDGQGAEGGMGAANRTHTTDSGYVGAGGGLGGANTTSNTHVPASGTAGTGGDTNTGNRPTPEDIAQPRDLQPASQAAASADATMPASIGSGSAGTAIGTDTMGQSRPAGPQAGGVNATGAASGAQSAAGTASAIDAANTPQGSQSGSAQRLAETTPGEVDQRNVPDGTGPTNAEAGDVGLGSASGQPTRQ